MSIDLTGLERFAFGDSPELADALLALVLAGTKTAWRAAHRAYFERNGGFAEDMPLWCERVRLVQPLPQS